MTSTKPNLGSPQVRKRSTSSFTREGIELDTSGQPRRKASAANVTVRIEPSEGETSKFSRTDTSRLPRAESRGRAEEVLLHRGFASSVPPELIRGLGNATSATVEVTWRSGKQQRFVVPAGNTSTLVEATGKAISIPFTKSAPRETARFPSTLESLGLRDRDRRSTSESQAAPPAQVAPRPPLLSGGLNLLFFKLRGAGECTSGTCANLLCAGCVDSTP